MLACCKLSTQSIGTCTSRIYFGYFPQKANFAHKWPQQNFAEFAGFLTEEMGWWTPPALASPLKLFLKTNHPQILYPILGCPRKLVKGEDQWIITPINLSHFIGRWNNPLIRSQTLPGTHPNFDHRWPMPIFPRDWIWGKPGRLFFCMILCMWLCLGLESEDVFGKKRVGKPATITLLTFRWLAGGGNLQLTWHTFWHFGGCSFGPRNSALIWQPKRFGLWNLVILSDLLALHITIVLLCTS